MKAAQYLAAHFLKKEYNIPMSQLMDKCNNVCFAQQCVLCRTAIFSENQDVNCSCGGELLDFQPDNMEQIQNLLDQIPCVDILDLKKRSQKLRPQLFKTL